MAQVERVSPDPLDRWDLQDSPVLREPLVLPGWSGLLEAAVHPVKLERLVLTDRGDLMESLERLESTETRGPQVSREPPDCRVLQDLAASQVSRAYRVCLGQSAPRVNQEGLERRVDPETQAGLGQLDRQERQEVQDQLASLELQVEPDLMDRQDRQASPDRPDLLEQ